MEEFTLSLFLRPRAEENGGAGMAAHPEKETESSSDASVFRLYALDFAHL
jgi:hypothetical protein